MILVRVDECTIATASGALTDNHALVKEPNEAFIPFYPFALRHQEIGASAPAGRRLFPKASPMCAREAEYAFLSPAFGAPTEYQAFEIALPGTSMVLDRQCQRDHPAAGTPK